MKKGQMIQNMFRLKRIITQFSKKLRDTSISAYAGLSAYMLILSFFPFFLFLTALLRHTSLTEQILLGAFDSFLPSSFHAFLDSLLDGIFAEHSATILPLTVISALWLASKFFLAVSNGLNAVYEIRETRNYVILRIWSIVYAALFAILILALLTLLVFGNALYHHFTRLFPFIRHILLPIISFRSSISFLVMLLFFSVIYYKIPNKKLVYRDQLPGALLATAGWLGFSYLYSFYVDKISNYASFYGTMTMIALLMVWLYACMYIFLFGGLLNYILQSYRISDYLGFLYRESQNESASQKAK